MKLVVIQGRTLAHYFNGKLGCVVEVADWDSDYRAFIEHFRELGAEAL